MCLGKISSIRKNSFLDFLSPLKFYLKKTVKGGPGVEISIIKKI